MGDGNPVVRTRSRRRWRPRGVVALVAGLALVAGAVGVAVVDPPRADAGVLSGFDPENIISDAVMFDGDTMTAAGIQTFLNGKQPSCASGATCLKSVRIDMPAMTANPMCGALPASRGQSAAQVIAAVGRACGVNPKVILVMLQKEQTLVTGRTPSSAESVSLIYRKATGLGCPDTAACDPAKYGLFNQLYGVAYWLVRYTTPPGTSGPGWTAFNWFPVGRPTGMLYNPSAACGAKTLTIRNKATASLYYYTPYTPNLASLAAGWGFGDSCSAYGNRNFYLYFTSWFGGATYPVEGDIGTVWRAQKGSLGSPLSAASAGAGGSSQRFEQGTVYSSSAGTFRVAGATLTAYLAMGGPSGTLGWPRKSQTTRTGASAGTAQGFQNGTIYVASGRAAAVLQPIYREYMGAGYELGRLGYPVASAERAGGVTQQRFERGRIVATAAGTVVLDGASLAIWLRRGGEQGTLGWPTSDAGTVSEKGRRGVVQTFQSGYVVTQGATRSVTGPLAANWASHGGVAGVLGWPVSVAGRSAANGGGWYQRFSGGIVQAGARTGVHALASGGVRTRYEQRGGPDGALGWLVRSGNDRTGIGGTYGIFQGGRIYSSRAGTAVLTGPILARWLAKGGTKGVLGWPLADATTKAGTTVQRFERGFITRAADGTVHAGRG